MSTGPRCSVTTSSILSTCSGSVTSRSTAMALPPESAISSATLSERSRVRAARATPAPASTRARANASPRPVLPPVTTAVLPVRSKASRTATLHPLPFSVTGIAGATAPRYPLVPSLPEQKHERRGAENAADNGGDDGDPGVSPVVSAFARYGQHGVGDAWSEVARRVDGVARGTPEGEPDAEDQQANQERREPRGEEGGQVAAHDPGVRADAEDAEEQHEGADDLGDNVRRGVVDGRGCTEYAELQSGIFCLRPVRQVREPHYDATDESAEELGYYVGKNIRPRELAGNG